LSLGGGSGWVVLSYSLMHKRLLITTAQDHTNALAMGIPILVMDMYEHAYQMDFGANAKAYIDVFFKNINWGVVENRLRQLEAQLKAEV
jgi:superoxide dismutase, Fe-Mn family